MLLQTNSYVVPKEKRPEHARLLARFRQTLIRLGAEHFEVYEQTGANWSGAEGTGRFVQIMRFRDRRQQLAVQAAERNDPTAQQLIREFCELINFPYQQQQGLFAVGFYTSVLPPLGGTALPGATGSGASEEPDESAPAGEGRSEAAQATPPANGRPEDQHPGTPSAEASRSSGAGAAPVPGEPIGPVSDEHSPVGDEMLEEPPAAEPPASEEPEEPLPGEQEQDVHVPGGEGADESTGEDLPDDRGPH